MRNLLTSNTYTKIKKYIASGLFLLSFMKVLAMPSLINLIPSMDEFPDLSIIGEAGIYKGNDLFTMIDGGAEVYLEFGFNAAISASYLYDSDNRIELQLYKMNDNSAAFGMLSYTRTKIDTIQMQKVLKITNPYYILFAKGEYYGVLSWNKPNSDKNDIYSKIFESISSKIESTPNFSPLLSKLLAANYEINDIKYVKGNLALSANHFFTHKNIFKIEEAAYIFNKSKGNFFILSYTNPEKCESVFKDLAEEFSQNTKVSDYTDSHNSIEYTDRRKRRVTMVKASHYITIGIDSRHRKELVELAIGFEE